MDNGFGEDLRCVKSMEIYGFTLCAVTMWLDRKLHDAFYDLEFISDDQQMLSVLFSPSMTYG